MMEKERERERSKKCERYEAKCYTDESQWKGANWKEWGCGTTQRPVETFPKIRCFCFHLCYQKENSGSIEF